MLASKPTSGLSLRAMIDLEESGRNWVAGDEVSSASSATRSTFSKRFLGLPAEPRPRGADGVFINLTLTLISYGRSEALRCSPFPSEGTRGEGRGRPTLELRLSALSDRPWSKARAPSDKQGIHYEGYGVLPPRSEGCEVKTADVRHWNCDSRHCPIVRGRRLASRATSL